MIGQRGTNHALGGHAIGTPSGPKKATSHNWSGYADDGGKTYTMVTARWKEPAVTCTPKNTDSLAAFWVGIDGYANSTVEQDGSLAYCDMGKPYYYTWWEMDPRNAVQLVGLSVKPGDEITATVTAKAVKTVTQYMLRVTDFTTSGNSFTEYQTCAITTCHNASAEWVAEAPAEPSPPGGLYPLANFRTWTVNAAAVKSGTGSGTISTFPAYEITMTSKTGVLASPGGLNPAGNWFADTWHSSTG
jgi:Peptidase A4 family